MQQHSNSVFLSTRQSLSTLKMDFPRELEFLLKLDLHVQLFGKDLKKFLDGYDEDCTLFIVVTRMNENEDELYHLETLPEPDMSKLRNWIRCGDPTGLRPEWKSIKGSIAKIKVYLAGQDLGIDCTSVMDNLFAEEEGQKYIYMYSGGDRKSIKKIAHLHGYVPLRTSSLSLLERKKLTIA